MKNPHVLTVGSIAFDSIETPSGKADRVLGGSGNYFSVAASFFSNVRLVGVVGEDFPAAHLDWLSRRKIDIAGVQRVAGKTFHWAGQYNQNLNEAKTLSTSLNVFADFNPVLPKSYQNSEYLFLANIDPVLQLRVLEQIERPKFVAMDTMNFWITGKLGELKAVLPKVDLLSINEGEAHLLSGQKNLTTAAQVIRSMGPKVVIIKRGEYGAMLIDDRGVFLASAFPVERVVDPTGAGDTFAGAMMGFLAEHGLDRTMAEENPEEWSTILRRGVLSGCVMASFTVEDFSLHRLMRLEKEEIITRQHQLLKMISIS